MFYTVLIGVLIFGKKEEIMYLSDIVRILREYDYVTSAFIWLMGFLLLIQLLPSKIKPYDAIFKSLGNKLNKCMSDKLEKTDKRIDAIADRQETNIRDIQQKFADDYRWQILGFSNSCKNGVRHTKEEWEHLIEQIHNYEDFVKKHGVRNDTITIETEYLRQLYKECLLNRDWLTCKDAGSACKGFCAMDKEDTIEREINE